MNYPFRQGRLAVVARALALLALPLWGAPATADEAQIYVGTTYPAIDGCSPDDSLPSADNMADGWYDEVTSSSYGRFSRDRRRVDGTIDYAMFCDRDGQLPVLIPEADCRDYSYLDEGDAALIVLHGSDSGDSWNVTMRTNADGVICGMNTPDDVGSAAGFSSGLYLGDSDLEFFHALSCHSMDDDNLDHIKYTFRDDDDSLTHGRHLHQMTGFHGAAAASLRRVGDYRNVARDGFSSPIADAWVDNLYDPTVRVDGETEAQCPIAYAVSTTFADCSSRLTTEQYDSGLADPSGYDRHCYLYWEDCNPHDESTFSD